MTGEETPAPGSTAGKTAPLPFDVSTAHQARMYDYVLGGKDNYAADRAAAEEWAKVDPGIVFTARANRAFLGRVVRYLTAEAGIRQFLDIGTGIPTAGNTHEVAQAIAPESRVVYVDYDPVVLAHARALLDSHEAGATGYINADLRDTGTILEQAAELLDLTRPVAVTLLAILHVIPDADDPHAVQRRRALCRLLEGSAEHEFHVLRRHRFRQPRRQAVGNATGGWLRELARVDAAGAVHAGVQVGGEVSGAERRS